MTKPAQEEPRITREAFEAAYAARSGMSPERWREYKVVAQRDVRPCVCQDEGCEGWQMAHLRDEDWPEDSAFPKSDPRYSASA